MLGVTGRHACPRAQSGKGISARRDVSHRVCHVGCDDAPLFPEAEAQSHLEDDVLDVFLIEQWHRSSKDALLESLGVYFHSEDARGWRRRQFTAKREHRHIPSPSLTVFVSVTEIGNHPDSSAQVLSEPAATILLRVTGHTERQLLDVNGSR